jgi:hypothetical protein
VGSLWVTYQDTREADRYISVQGARITATDEPVTFQPAPAIPSSRKGNFGDITIGPDGQVLVAYQVPNFRRCPEESRSRAICKADILTNLDVDGLGPASFAPAVSVSATEVGLEAVPPQSTNRIDAEVNVEFDRSGGDFRGKAYLVYTDKTGSLDSGSSGDTEVLLRNSSDKGVTWSAPKRVNDDDGGATQFLPHLAMDESDGTLAITFYDSRRDAEASGENKANDEVHLFGAIADPGGEVLSPNFAISSKPSKETLALAPPSPARDLDFGDYTGAAFHHGLLFPVWADNSNATRDNPDGDMAFDLYTSIVDISKVRARASAIKGMFRQAFEGPLKRCS